MVPPGSRASSGPFRPQSSAAARAVPSPASTIRSRGPVAIAASRLDIRSAASGARMLATRPYSSRIAASCAGASGPTLPEARFATTSMRSSAESCDAKVSAVGDSVVTPWPGVAGLCPPSLARKRMWGLERKTPTWPWSLGRAVMRRDVLSDRCRGTLPDLWWLSGFQFERVW